MLQTELKFSALKRRMDSCVFLDRSVLESGLGVEQQWADRRGEPLLKHQRFDKLLSFVMSIQSIFNMISDLLGLRVTTCHSLEYNFFV